MPSPRRWILTSFVALLAGCGGDLAANSDDASSSPEDVAITETVPAVDADPEEDAPIDVAPDAPPLDPDITDIPRNPTAFSIGLMAGDAEPTRAMLWTRYTGKRELRARVAEVEGGKATKVVLEQIVKPAEGGFVHIDAGSLTPATEYQYAFLEHDGTKYVGRSDGGRFRTATADDALTPITFGGTSCNHINGAPFASLSFAATAKFDFFVHAGDHIYGDAAETLPEYRSVYEKWEVKNLAAVHRSTGMYTIWDDHEVVNSWASDTVPEARVKAARQAFFEHRAGRRAPHRRAPPRARSPCTNPRARTRDHSMLSRNARGTMWTSHATRTAVINFSRSNGFIT